MAATMPPMERRKSIHEAVYEDRTDWKLPGGAIFSGKMQIDPSGNSKKDLPVFFL